MSRPTVGLDITPVIQGRTGIARYASALVRHLPGEGVDVRPFALGRASVPVPDGVRHLGVPLRILEPSMRRAGRPRAEDLLDRLQLVHGTSLPPPPSRLPRLVTVHDLAAVRHPELHEPRTVKAIRHLVAALPKLAGVIAVSRTVADELAERGVPSERITVALNGLPPMPSPADPGVDLTAWLLCVGETNRRKNIRLVLEALGRSAHRDLGLVVAGPPGNDDVRLRRRVAELGLEPRVRFLGHVTEPRLAGLYRDALALCYPSFDEGFGLPVVEAMAAGTPVVCSELAVLREVAGEAAVAYVGVSDVDALVAAIDAVVGLTPAARARFEGSGRRQAGLFTWEACARATRDAYERALS